MIDLDTGTFYMLVGTVLFGIGFYGLIAYPHLLRKILAMNIMGIGVFMIFIAAAYGSGEGDPDPVPHALVITGIVVAVCATGLALSLAVQVQALTGSPKLDADKE
ncbi:MAG: Na+/H+ antiporter subunit C [Anaerolineaceae bacterium]|nr:MAG: Na+/H+ antiporter subunit C [Anaerolineaceae bacterium]